MLQAAGTPHDIILGGDFNLLMDSVLDHSEAKVCKPPRATLTLHRMCKNLGLTDIWRLLNPSGRDYTFFSSVHKIYSRIDFFLFFLYLSPSFHLLLIAQLEIF